MVKNNLEKVIIALRQATRGLPEPMMLTIIKEFSRDPFLVLVSCILSLRTKDSVSLAASHRLFQRVKMPQELLTLSLPELQKLIYPVGFYRRKARQLHALCK